MRAGQFFIANGMFLLVELTTFIAAGDVVWRKEGEPVVGRIVSGDSVHGVEIELAESGREIMRIESAMIAGLHRSTDASRLAGLTPDSPGDYFDYAVELSGLSFDHSATGLSRELATIALHYSLVSGRERGRDIRLARQSALLLKQLAASPEQLSRINQLAIANGLWSSQADFGQPNSGWEPDVETIRQNASRLLELTIQLRRGELASRELPDEDFALFRSGYWQQLMTEAEFKSLLEASNFSVIELRRLLAWEMELEKIVAMSPQQIGRAATDPDGDQGGKSWALQSRYPPLQLTENVSTFNVTSHNPKNCLWRDGKWLPESPD